MGASDTLEHCPKPKLLGARFGSKIWYGKRAVVTGGFGLLSLLCWSSRREVTYAFGREIGDRDGNAIPAITEAEPRVWLV